MSFTLLFPLHLCNCQHTGCIFFSSGCFFSVVYTVRSMFLQCRCALESSRVARDVCFTETITDQTAFHTAHTSATALLPVSNNCANLTLTVTLQNTINSSLIQIPQISRKSTHNILSYAVNNQTNQHGSKNYHRQLLRRRE